MGQLLTVSRLRSAAAFAIVVAVSVIGVPGDATAQAVKKSRSGICHCPGGQNYGRTTNFSSFDTMEACLASGGRHPQRGQGTCPAVSRGSSAETRIGANGVSGVGRVRKSGSGICHCPGGQYYDRTTNFTAFDTLEVCLASGGREPQRGQGTCPGESGDEPAAAILTLAIPRLASVRDRYDRSAFGGWADEDADCQDTREERLIARSIEPVELSDGGCRVMSGRWEDPYTGNVHLAPTELDIDHLVPLHYAWERGADLWEPAKQRHFANDPANLLPVGASVNRSKGAAGPLQWLPPAEAFVCEYLLRFSRVVARYELVLPANEAVALEGLTDLRCN